MTPDTVPILPRGVRKHFDTVRNVRVLLGPERVLMLDQVGDAVLTEVDGESSVTVISARLAARYNAPKSEIEADVTAYLLDLSHKGLLELRDD
ncbi:MAG: pyrroloquinoline quinone biosynthesis peptide chaperone PqqD [Pseudomonadota bacterium]